MVACNSMENFLIMLKIFTIILLVSFIKYHREAFGNKDNIRSWCVLTDLCSLSIAFWHNQEAMILTAAITLEELRNNGLLCHGHDVIMIKRKKRRRKCWSEIKTDKLVSTCSNLLWHTKESTTKLEVKCLGRIFWLPFLPVSSSFPVSCLSHLLNQKKFAGLLPPQCLHSFCCQKNALLPNLS